MTALDSNGAAMHAIRVESGQGGRQKKRGASRVQRAKVFPSVGDEVAVGLRREVWVVRVRDGVEIRNVDAAFLQAPRRRLLRKLPSGERHRALAMLAAAEALLLSSGHDATVDHQRGRRVVKNCVDAEDFQDALLSWGRCSTLLTTQALRRLTRDCESCDVA
jgi:hypothetical protein